MIDIKFAAMSLTWNNPGHESFHSWLSEVKGAGYDGITGFAHDPAFQYFLNNPKVFAALLDQFDLGLASLDVMYQEDLDYYKRVSEFLAYNHCSNMAYIDPKGKPKDFVKLGNQLNAVGTTSLQYGVRTLYHNHTRGIGETFLDLEQVHTHVDPDKVFVMLDLGHATMDFIDLPVEERAIHFLRKYWDQIKFMEFKDWNEKTKLNTPVGEGYCDYSSVFQLIKEKGFRGWITVEQNGNDGLSLDRKPVDCARISREFIRDGLGI